jgi:RNA polymerase sigma-70 factor (ECF subfamily)
MPESPTTPDEDLIRRARAGDRAAFELLVHRHDRHVLLIAARYAGTVEDAEDIYQEVFLRVWRALPDFRFQSEFRTWVHRITVNVCLSFRSRRALPPPRTVSTEGDEEDPGEIPDTEELPDTRAITADLSRSVQRAMECLSPKQRIAFSLRHHEGYKIKEIAALMNCREGTVKRYLFAATRRLRRELQDYL